MITIRCDRIDPETFKLCTSELSGLAFNQYPQSWKIVDLGEGDHMDYCPMHAS